MEVLRNLSDLLRKWRRRHQSDADKWVDVWQTPYALAYAILYHARDVEKAAEDVADKALLSFVGKVDRLRHRKSNRTSYGNIAGDESGDTKFRRIALPHHLELAESVFSFTTPKEIEIAERGDATLDDQDIWYIKHVLQHVLQFRNAFSACVGMSRGIHAYSPVETNFVWYQAVEMSPRRLEQFGESLLNFDTYWRGLRRTLRERFGGLITLEPDGDITRRPREQQPRELVARYVQLFTMFAGDNPCGIESRAWTEDASDSIKAEERRLHTFLHRPCYQELIGLANDGDLPIPNSKLGLPKYSKIMSSNNHETNDRTPPLLSEEKLKQKRQQLEELLKLRGRATSDIVVTVDGVERERESASLKSVGSASFVASERSQVVEVWARRESGADVFLTSCLLSQGGRREVAELEGGQRLLFHVRYAEDESGGGAYEIRMRYQETRPSRRRALARERRVFAGHPAWQDKLASRRVIAPAGAVLLGAFLILAVNLNNILHRVFYRTLTTATSLSSNHNIEHPSPSESAAVTVRMPEVKNLHLDTHGWPPPTGKGDDQTGTGTSTSDRSTQTASAPRSRDTKGGGGSRGVAHGWVYVRERVPTSVAPVTTVYVEKPSIFEKASLNLDAYSAAVARLTLSKLFRVVQNPDAAQAHLIFASGHRSPLGDKVQPQLVTARGKAVIWTGRVIPLFDEDEPQAARRKAEDVGRRITEALIEQKESELSQRRR